MRVPSLLAVIAATALAAGCIVPDKFYSDAGGGDDSGDGGVDIDGGIDTAAPETTIDSAPAALSNDATPSFEFSANEPATFVCSVDGAAPEACTSPFAPTLADGPHTFSVAAIDTSGNQDDTPAEHVWSMDTVAPNTTITMGPPANDNSATVMISFTSDETGVTFDCIYDGTPQACTSPVSLASPNGAHNFSVRATDTSGNVDATPATRAWTTDLSTPDTTIDTGPSGSVSSASATFTFSSPNAGGGATFECALDTPTFTSCTSPQTYNALTQVSHTFQVRVRNLAGTADPSPASRTWTVDTTNPTTTIATGPTEGSTVTSNSALFTFTSNEASATFECALDTPVVFAACPASHTLSGLGQGPHALQVRAVDLANNRDATPAVRNWSVDSVGPTVTINSGPANGSTSGPFVTFTFTIGADAVGGATCRTDGGTFAACTSPISYSLNDNTHSFEVRAVDSLGNGTSATRSWNVDCAGQTGGPGGIILFHFDEASGQTVENELSTTEAVLGSTNQVSTDDPARISTGRFGRALRFTPGERDTVRWQYPVGTFVPGLHDYSIEAWVRPGTTMSPARQVVVDIDEVAVWYTSTAAGVRFSHEIVDAAGVPVLITGPGVAANTWYHVVATYSGTTMRLYLNGAQVATGSVSYSGTPFSLANVYVSPSVDPLDLDADEVFIGNEAMTATDVLTRYCPL